jgi:hypothetical protein
MGTGRDTAADRIQVMLHGVGIGARKRERGAGVARRADCLSSPALKSVRNGTAAPIAPSRIIPAQEAWNQTAIGDGISSQRVRLNEAWYNRLLH